MTCYLHIGTPKTGTTTIQEFLFLNKNLFKKKDFFVPYSLGEKNHTKLSLASMNPATNQHKIFLAHYLKQKLYYNDDKKLYNLKIIDNLKKELNTVQQNNIIISSENIQESLIHEYDIENMRNILTNLNFNQIYIILYLRAPEDLFISLYSMLIKAGYTDERIVLDTPQNNNFMEHICNHKNTIKRFSNIFGKDKIIVKLFNQEDFFKQNLLKDFVNCLKLNWDDNFLIPQKLNEGMDILGIKLCYSINKYLPRLFPDNRVNSSRRQGDLERYFNKYFTSKNPELKFQPPKEIYQSYIDYFEESNEWVRKEFFPCKERLFPKKDMSTYKENYELREMKPEYWDKIAEFIADIIKTKNENILSLNQNLKIRSQELDNQSNQIYNLNKTLENKNQLLTAKENLLNFQNHYGKAKTRIQNQLSYKLGQTLIINSKSVLGYLSLLFIILSIVISHKQEQKAYKFKVKKNPNLALPPLETYPDYNEALKEKECFTYKLGEEFIKASKNWHKGGYIKFYFKDVPRLKREIKENK
ncbi:TPA: hypothetical protein ACHDWQ_000795 [Campylobacter jejuni]